MSALNKIRIATPCTADWGQMAGTDRKRFCAQCKLNVYNLSAMTQPQAERMLREAAGGRLCVRVYQRPDGTVLTQDCPVGIAARLRRVGRRAAAMVALAFSLLVAMLAAGCGHGGVGRPAGGGAGGAAAGANENAGKVEQQPPVDNEPRVLMGDVCEPQRPVQPPLAENR